MKEDIHFIEMIQTLQVQAYRSAGSETIILSTWFDQHSERFRRIELTIIHDTRTVFLRKTSNWKSYGGGTEWRFDDAIELHQAYNFMDDITNKKEKRDE